MYGQIRPRCGAQVNFQDTRCPACDRDVGYPNVRRAGAMRADLDRHYTTALVDADARGIRARVDELERLLESSVATINIEPKMLELMSSGTKYANYHQAMAEHTRHNAEQIHSAHRGAADAKVHTDYGDRIVNAALSPDGRGLPLYGEVTLRLLDKTIAERASVLRENAFLFYERHDLGNPTGQEEPGWRAVWADRARLGVAKLVPEITTVTASRDLPAMVLSLGATRHDDRFLEVHIHGTINWQALAGVSLDKPLTDGQKQDDWDTATRRLSRNGVSVETPFKP